MSSVPSAAVAELVRVRGLKSHDFSDPITAGGNVRVSVWRPTEGTDSPAEGCLTDRELEVARTYRSPRRHREFLDGRFLAKRAALATHRDCVVRDSAAADLKRVEILADSPESGSSRRVVRVDGIRQPGSVSISHADGWTAVALTTADGLGVGIDLTIVHPRNSALRRLWLTPREQQLVEHSDDRELSLAALWSIKEALFKATARSQRFIPREWETTVEARTLRCFQAGVFVPADIRLFRFSPNAVACLAICENN